MQPAEFVPDDRALGQNLVIIDDHDIPYHHRTDFFNNDGGQEFWNDDRENQVNPLKRR